VETSLSSRMKRWWPAVAAATAGLFIVAMVITGSLPESRQFVKFEAKGVMRLAPERITQAAIEFGGNRYTLTRTGERAWTREAGAELDANVARDASMAVQFMNTSGPTREMSAEELKGAELTAFGLDRPRVSVTLYQGPTRIITAHFGAHNPGGLLQYMSVDGRDEVFLMSRFVGEQWEQVASQVSLR
jgi:hypothetical protein